MASHKRENGAGKRTEKRVLEAAERLFARYGRDAVSLRQIAEAAGSSNSNVVQYHFGDKDGLLKALFERRLGALEQARARLFQEAKAAGKTGETRALVEVIFRPIAEAFDSEGRPSYAAFLLSLPHHEGSMATRHAFNELSPFTTHVSDLMVASVPHVPTDVALARVQSILTLFLSSMVRWDQDRVAQAPGLLPWSVQLTEALDMATAALSAPVSAAVLEFSLGKRASL